MLLWSVIVDVMSSLEEMEMGVSIGRIEELYAVAGEIGEKYREKAVEELGKRHQIVWGVALTISAVLIAGYLLAVRRLVNRMVHFTVEEWRILMFLPTEAATVVLRLLKQ